MHVLYVRMMVMMVVLSMGAVLKVGRMPAAMHADYLHDNADASIHMRLSCTTHRQQREHV